jgi:hypothetical protein
MECAVYELPKGATAYGRAAAARGATPALVTAASAIRAAKTSTCNNNNNNNNRGKHKSGF